jgi:RNA polymerase sigma-70 factor (ECF subfamily)
MGDAAVLNLSEKALNSEDPLARAAKRRVDSTLVRELVDAHHRFIWRLLARLGVREADLDDAVQRVFMVLTQKAELEVLEGSERAFLFGVAVKVARTYRRTLLRRREASTPPAEPIDTNPTPEALTEQHQARLLLDQLLDDMPDKLRVPFVLFELDDMGTAEIASLLALPGGTVASRLRRAREWFDRRVQQLQAREQHSRGGR